MSGGPKGRCVNYTLKMKTFLWCMSSTVEEFEPHWSACQFGAIFCHVSRGGYREEINTEFFFLHEEEHSWCLCMCRVDIILSYKAAEFKVGQVIMQVCMSVSIIIMLGKCRALWGELSYSCAA